jgi:hypothetical protein
LRLEKAVERLAMLPIDFRTAADQQRQRAAALLHTLSRLGVNLDTDDVKLPIRGGAATSA